MLSFASGYWYMFCGGWKCGFYWKPFATAFLASIVYLGLLNISINFVTLNNIYCIWYNFEIAVRIATPNLSPDVLISLFDGALSIFINWWVFCYFRQLCSFSQLLFFVTPLSSFMLLFFLCLGNAVCCVPLLTAVYNINYTNFKENCLLHVALHFQHTGSFLEVTLKNWLKTSTKSEV